MNFPLRSFYMIVLHPVICKIMLLSGSSEETTLYFIGEMF